MMQDTSGIDLNGKTILITGGAGFIGSSLAKKVQLLFPESRIVVFDCFSDNTTFSNGNLQSYGNYNNLIGFKGDIICGDLASSNDLKYLETYSFDYIFHQAAISDTRVNNQEIVFRNNINTFHSVVNLARRSKCPLVYASSAATYGDLPAPQTEGCEAPNSPYAFSKYAMDQITRNIIESGEDISIIGLRYFNVYGPGEAYKYKTASMVFQLGIQILKDENPKLFDGSKNYRRDFVFIDDVILANLHAAVCGNSGVVNIGTGASRTFVEVAEILLRELGSSNNIDLIPNPYSSYQASTCASLKHSEKLINYKTLNTLEVGIKKNISYILAEFEKVKDF